MLKKLLTNRYFYLSLAALVLFGSLTLFIADKWIMPAYTNYNEGQTVPDVTRLSLQEAQTLLEESGLRYEVTDRRSNSAFPANYVIDQTPSAEIIVKPNRKIYLTVNTEVKPTVEVPNVEDLSLRNAEIQLQNYGLTVGSRSYESSRFKNVILRQSIPEGAEVEKGTAVDLVVSDGLGDKMIEVPDIVGSSLPDAQQQLSRAGFRVGEIQFRPTRDVVPNTVLDYNPKAEELREGETLNLIISERYEAIEQSEDGAVIIDSTEKESESPDNNDE